MLAKFGMALAMVFSAAAYAAPRCNDLKEALRLPLAPISLETIRIFANGTDPDGPNNSFVSGLSLATGVAPGKANFLFITGNNKVLPVEKIQINMMTRYFKGEQLPRVVKDYMQVSLVSPEPGGMAFVNIKFPKFAGKLYEGYHVRDSEHEVSYNDGILTYKEHQEIFFQTRNFFGFLKEQRQTKVTIVKMEIDENLSRFGHVSFTQHRLDDEGNYVESNTIASRGSIFAEKQFSMSSSEKMESDLAGHAGLFGLLMDYVQVR